MGNSPLKENLLDMSNLKSRVTTWEYEELVSDTMHTQESYSHEDALEFCALGTIQK